MVSSPRFAVVSFTGCALSVCLDVAKVLFQEVEPLLPHLAMLFDPAGGSIESGSFEAARPVLGISTATDQSGPFEHLEVLRDRLQRDLERLGQFVDSCFSGGETSDNRPPGRVGECGKCGAERVVVDQCGLHGLSGSGVFNQ